MTAVETPRDRAQPLEDADVERLIAAALEEDLGPHVLPALRGASESPAVSGDVTSEGIVPENQRARARLLAKASGVLAGCTVFVRVFRQLDPTLRVQRALEDGARLASGDEVAVLEGRARALLAGERTALNLVQRMSGIATLTARFVAAARPARVLDTRKTTPGLRALEKHAVLCGGGENHRFGLFDQVLVKNNHVDLARTDLRALVAALRQRHGPAMRITAEARDEREALDAIAGGADVVLLDNFAPAALRALCPRLRAAAAARTRPLELEASGGITLANAAEYAAAGVDRLSVGALTHSAAALDLSLRLEPLG